MAINDIKIKSHDIYLERNSDKGGNLIIGASTTTNSLTVNTNTTNKGGLTVGTSDSQGDINVYGNILLYGNTERTISCKDRLNLDTPYINFSGSTNSTIINSPMINIKTENINIENCYYKKVCNLNDVCDSDGTDFKFEMISYTGPFTGVTEVKCYKLTISSSLSDSEIEDFNKYRFIGRLKLIVEFESETKEIILSDNGFTLDGRTLKLTADGSPDTRDHPNLTYNNYSKLNEATRIGEDIIGVTFMVLSSQKDIALSINQETSVNINKHKHILLNCAPTGTTNISHFPNTTYSTKYQKLVIATTSNVSLYPGDFIEYYPTVDERCLIVCDELGWSTGNGLDISNIPGYVYYASTGTKVYIYRKDGLRVENVKSERLLLKFQSSTGSALNIVIKR